MKEEHTDRFERLFRTYYADLCTYARSIVGSEASAEDIVQDVFAQLWERRGAWRPHTSEQAYLYRAVRNNAFSILEHHRVARRSEKEVDEIQEGGRPDQAYQRDQMAAAIRTAVAHMPERQREVFRLSRYGDLTYREIATVLDIAPSTVETHMVRALRFLREAIQVHR